MINDAKNRKEKNSGVLFGENLGLYNIGNKIFFVTNDDGCNDQFKYVQTIYIYCMNIQKNVELENFYRKNE